MTPNNRLTWVSRIHPTFKALAALALAGGVGLTCSGAWGTPAQADMNTAVGTKNAADIAEVQRTHIELKEGVTEILCILRLPEGAYRLDCVEL